MPNLQPSIEARQWKRGAKQIISYALQATPQFSPPPTTIPKPRANALIVRGLSWRDDSTLAGIERSLHAREINPIRFNYLGIDDFRQPTLPGYDPTDILTHISMETAIRGLDLYVRGILNDSKWRNVPILLAGHSLGGITIANWICQPNPQPDHEQILKKITGISLYGTPLFPPKRVGGKVEVDLGSSIPPLQWVSVPLGFDMRRLFFRYPNLLTNVVGTRDLIARIPYGSAIRPLRIANRGGRTPRLEEIAIDGAGHSDVATEAIFDQLWPHLDQALKRRHKWWSLLTI